MRLLNMNIMGPGDKAAFADIFLDELGYRPSLIGSVMAERSIQENDNLLWALVGLEEGEAEAGRIAKVRRIKQIVEELERVMDNKEEAGESP